MSRRLVAMIGSRANYASLKSVLLALRERSDIELVMVGFASATSSHYGRLAEIMAGDGLPIDLAVESLTEGETPLAMARTTGLSLIELAGVLKQCEPDAALVVGDRHEVLAAAIAASYQNIPLAHTMGGEVTGTIDESVRHAITKLAHIHFPATKLAGERIVQMGEMRSSVFVTGCPRLDVAREAFNEAGVNDLEMVFGEGVGQSFSLEEPFLLVSQHPVTSEFESAGQQMTETLLAIQSTDLPFVLLWPNADAGSASTSRAIRKWREDNPGYPAHMLRTLPMNVYLRLMKRTTALVGNSSSGVREGAFIGTPVVNIGSRQAGREQAGNVENVEASREQIQLAIWKQMQHGPYSESLLYGDGEAGARISRVLAEHPLPHVQKSFAELS